MIITCISLHLPLVVMILPSILRHDWYFLELALTYILGCNKVTILLYDLKDSNIIFVLVYFL